MDSLLFYIVKLVAYSAIFYAYYWIFLRNSSFIEWARWYIISATALSFILPLLNIPIIVVAMPVVQSSYTILYSYELNAAEIFSHHSFSLWKLASGIYLSGLLILLILTLVTFIKTMQLKRISTKQSINGVPLYIISKDIAPFSFFNAIFCGSNICLNTHEGQLLLKHEMAHVRCMHSVDKFLMLLVCSIVWINPFFWLLRRELVAVHEFSADRASIEKGEASTLSKLILYILYPKHHVHFSNQLIQTPIKRRLTMITKHKTNFETLRKLMVIPTMLAAIALFSLQCESNNAEVKNLDVGDPTISDQAVTRQSTSNETVIFEEVPTKPTFNGGDANEFAKWVNQNIVYPKEAIEKNIQGRVIVKFTVTANGSVTDVKVVRGIDKLLDDEASRIVSASPKWVPGKDLNGKNIGVIYVFPVKFALQY